MVNITTTIGKDYTANESLVWTENGLEGKWFDSGKDSGFSQWYKVEKIK